MQYFKSSISCITLAAAVLGTALAASGDAAAQDNPNVLKHQGGHTSGLIATVRESAKRFSDIEVAFAEGYVLFLGCVSSPEVGAMGQHLINFALASDDILDATTPEVLVYEPKKNGEMRLVGVDYVVFYDAWHAIHDSPPVIQGQSLFLIPGPNRFGPGSFYTLHVWAFKHNWNGAFAMWHPNVSCDNYDPS